MVSSDSDASAQEGKANVRGTTTFYDRFVTDWWWWELCSWFVSFICVAAIVGMLLAYDGRKQPVTVLPGVTFNAYIATFAAISKAAMILPVSEAIGQLKWMWFREEHQLADFSAFDNASRGPWGSLMLLRTTTYKHLASLGASITILALAFEPFFQQVVSFPSRALLDASSSISIATAYEPLDRGQYDVPAPFNAQGFFFGGKSMAQDVANAMLLSEAATRSAPFNCSTGTCDWPIYSSLGVCHQCEDVSYLLTPVCRKELIATPLAGAMEREPCGYQMDDIFFVGTSDDRVLGLVTAVVGSRKFDRNSSLRVFESTAFPNASHTIIDFYVAYTPGGIDRSRPNTTARLLECVMQWCVKSFETTFAGGQMREKVTSMYIPQDTTDTAAPQDGPVDLSIKPNDPFTMNAAGKSFDVGANRTRQLSNAILANLPRRLTGSDENINGEYPGLWKFVQTEPYDIRSLLDPVTKAMTDSIRLSSNSATENILGSAWRSENFVQIQWYWLSLPCSLLFGTLALICTTIVKTKKIGMLPWKSSALATLHHGLTEDARQIFRPDSSMSEAEVASRKMHMKITGLDGRGRLACASAITDS